MALSVVAVPYASASGGASWYAYATGAAPSSATTCPETSTANQECTLGEALSLAGAGDTVYLATPGGTGTGEAAYVGNWSVATTGTSASAPLTIEPASGVADPTLSGNGGNSSGCTTSSCDGPVLTIGTDAYVDISAVTFQDADNDTTNVGGAVVNNEGGTLDVSSSTFSGNVALNAGGAIANGDVAGSSGTLTVSGSTFSDNVATSYAGGAIDSGDNTGTGVLSISASTFSANAAHTDGGAIDSGDESGTGTLTISGSTFSGNAVTSADGGAIDSGDHSGTGTLSVSTSTFSANTAVSGGAIDSGDNTATGTLTISTSTFSDNTATGYDGGAIDSGDGGTDALTVTSSTFSANRAQTDGGAIDSGDGGNATLSVSGSTFSGNTATGYDGGAIDNGDDDGTDTLTATSSTFSANTAGVDGGAIDNGDFGGTGTLSVSRSTFSGNLSTDRGGAIDNGDLSGNGTLSVTSSTFSANSSGADGGAINSGDDSGTGTLNVTSSTFSANSSGADGGAIDEGDYGGTGRAAIVASTFAGNTLTATANTMVAHNGATIDNGDNKQASGGGSSTLAVAADILDGSCGQGGGTWDDAGYNVGSDDSCFSPTPAGTDNDSAGTGLASLLGALGDNGGPTETLLPLPGNPAVGLIPDGTSASVGGTSELLCPTTDQRGVTSASGQPCNAGSVQQGGFLAEAHTYSATEGTELTEPSGALLAGIVDDNPGATSWTAELSSTASDGTAVVNLDGSFTYTPKAGFVGTDSFSYALKDNLGYTSVPAPVTINVATSSVPTTTAPAVEVPAPTTTTTTTAAAPPTEPFPHANVSYPNGAIVGFGGKDYVLAGGRAFVASAAELGGVEKVDHAKALTAPAGAAPPTATAPRSGTLLSTRAVNGTTAIYVAGADGELHEFSTPGQFSRDGYDPTLVVTVPSLGGLRVGSSAGAAGPAVTALATRADGAVVDSSGTFFVFAGGRAFGVSTPAVLVTVRRADKATVLDGSVSSAEAGAAVASGALLSAPGKVYVSYQGDLYPFKGKRQLTADGYGGTGAVPVPGTGGLSVSATYSGA
jgi:hypothetical protein